MSDKKFGIGIVGLGNISDVHAEAIKLTNDGKLVSAYSSTEKKVKKFEKSYGAKGYTSYEDFLKDPELDIVSICTPSGTHLDFGKAAAEAGKHVVVEKPIEVTLKKAGALIDSCKANGVKLAVIYQSRFSEDTIKMKQAIDNGEIGDVFMSTASVKWFRDQEYYTSSPWRGTFKLDGGGAVINQSIHTIDLLVWMLGGIDSVQAYKGTFTHPTIEAEDNAVSIFRTKSGSIGTFVASTSIVPPFPRRIEVFGSEGSAVLDESTFRLLKTEDDLKSAKDSAEDATGGSSPLAHFKFDPHKNQFNAIMDAIREDRDPPVSGTDSLQSLAFVEGLYKSADSGEQVKLDNLLEKYSK
jgi:UDP-N-acetyl-2-amino-2-deoxyglucuronate dehydrogenase